MRERLVQPRGFTLVESAISIALVGIMLVTATGSFGAIARLRRQQMESRQAMMLAQSLMAEIEGEYFIRQGAAGTTRATFACIDDYNGYSASPPVDAAGTSIAGYTGWKEQVTTGCVDPTNPATAVSSSTLKSIQVTITAPSGKQYSLTGLRSSFGPYEIVPGKTTTYVTGTTVRLQGAAPATIVYGAAHPFNVVTSQ